MAVRKPRKKKAPIGGSLPRRCISLDDDAPRVVIYTDGGCEPNPGPGGWAAILRTDGWEREIAGSDAETTNNRMELQAALEGLKALKKPSRVTIITDSNYLNHGMTEWITGWSAAGWRRGKSELLNKELWYELATHALRHETSWAWTRGHAGQPENERCDELATRMIELLNATGDASHSEIVERSGKPPRLPGKLTGVIWFQEADPDALPGEAIEVEL